MLGNATILGEYNEPDRIDIEPPCRRKPAQMRCAKTQRQFVVLVAVFRFDQFHGRAITQLGQVGNVADGFVEQYGDTRLLFRLRLPRERDGLIGEYACTQLCHWNAIHHHPALLDIAVGLAARADALLGHQFGDTNFFHLPQTLWPQINADEHG